jgi:hypothetical protein
MSITSGTAVLLYWWMHHIETQLTRYQLPIILGFTALFALSFMGGAATAVFGLFLLTRVLRMVSVNNETQIQHHAPDESRATLGSLYSFVGKLVSAALVTGVGLFAINDKIVSPIRWSVLIITAALLLGALLFSLGQNKLHTVTEPGQS